MNIKYQIASFALIALLLTACGGGGGSSTTKPSNNGGDSTTDGGGTSNGGGSTSDNTSHSIKSGSIIKYDDLSAWSFRHPTLTLGDLEELIMAEGGDSSIFIESSKRNSYGNIGHTGLIVDFIGDKGSRGVAFNKKDKKLYYIDSKGNLYKISLSSRAHKYEIKSSEIIDLATKMPNLDTSGNPIRATGVLQDIAIDKNGNIILATDSYILKMTPNQPISATFIGRDKNNANIRVLGLAIAEDGTVYFTTKGASDNESYLVKKLDVNSHVSLLAGNVEKGFKDGKGEAAQFEFLSYGNGIGSGLVVYKNNVYVADSQNHRIRKITPDGTVTTYAGGGTESILFNNKGPDKLKAEIFKRPLDIVVNSKGDFYLSTLWGSSIYKIVH